MSGYRFVGAGIWAVDSAVAAILARNARAITTIETGIGRAARLGAVLAFVRVVAAVVLSVAVPLALDAAAVGARELVRGARSV